MIETNTFLTDLLNCLSWVALTGALIYAIIRIVESHREVKMAIVKKLKAETERIENGNYNTRKY